MKTNPFPISSYISPEYFCDRVEETDNILSAINNRRHLTIFSARRIGKTALIKHAFYNGKKKKSFIPVYCDILATSSIKDFTESFGRSVLSSIASNETGIKKILKNLASLRPKAGIDAITGDPYISLAINNNQEAVESLHTIFRYIQDQKRYFVIALDEFQQITGYPERNTEAVLRTYLQHTDNVCMIFSGSRKHILAEIFSSPNRPFFSSTQMMEISKINTDEYKSFILEKFESNGIKTDSAAIDLLLEVTSGHTFYVQYLCNRLFSSENNINTDAVRQILMKTVNENEAVYASYIAVLTQLQFRIIRAIGLNRGVRYPTSGEFISKYDLGASSSVSLAIKSLMDKEFIDFIDDQYLLNDRFFEAWLRLKADLLF
jgi:uncharacterized protein